MEVSSVELFSLLIIIMASPPPPPPPPGAALRHYYTDDKCTIKSDLPENDPHFHMKYGTSYYTKDGGDCVSERKTKTYFSTPIWPKTSFCRTDSAGKEVCFENVTNIGGLMGCSLMNMDKLERGDAKIDCRAEGQPPECVIS